MRGWYRENYRHSLAARGIKTSFSRKSFVPFEFDKYRESDPRSEKFMDDVLEHGKLVSQGSGRRVFEYGGKFYVVKDLDGGMVMSEILSRQQEYQRYPHRYHGSTETNHVFVPFEDWTDARFFLDDKGIKYDEVVGLDGSHYLVFKDNSEAVRVQKMLVDNRLLHSKEGDWTPLGGD